MLTNKIKYVILHRNNQLNPINMITWSEYEEKYGESREDFYEEPETSWEQSEADAAGVPLFGAI
jgi:hypothetical protein